MINRLKILLIFISSIHLNLFSQEPDDTVQKLTDYVKNGQLVYYIKAVATTTVSGSEITYVNFCPDGTYNLKFDGSFIVKGPQGTSSENDMGYGSRAGTNYGKWSIGQNMGSYFLQAINQKGEVGYYPINIQNLMNGKWVVGRTTYVFAPNKAECY